MADETPPPPGAPGPPDRRRPAPTIDLKATEIASEPAASTQTPPSGPPPDQDTAAKMPPRSALHRSLFELAAAVSWPLVGAGVAGAILSLGVVWMVATLSAGQGGDASAASARIAQLEREVADLAGHAPANAASVTDLANRLQKLEAQVAQLAARPPEPDAVLANRIGAAETQLKSLGETVGALGRRSESAAAANAAAVSELTQKLARADASQSAATSNATADANAALIAALANRVDALESGAKTIADTLAAAAAKRSAESADDHAVRAAIIAAALAAAVERGDPFAGELKAAQSQAADASVLTPLESFAVSGVPSERALARELSSLEPELLRAAGTVSTESGILQKLQANAERLVRIRPIAEVAGDDPATVIARAEIKAGRGDVPGALMELGNLPAQIRAPAQAWIEQAQTRAAALAASHAFAAEALSRLGKPSQ